MEQMKGNLKLINMHSGVQNKNRKLYGLVLVSYTIFDSAFNSNNE